MMDLSYPWPQECLVCDYPHGREAKAIALMLGQAELLAKDAY